MLKTYLTIIVPTYNKQKYLVEALDSILMQKTEFNYKILIIDDFSTDKSINIIRNYSKKHPDKIDFFQNSKNLGLLSTILKGYELTKTPYFCVLDPDDYWIDKNKIQKAVSFLNENKNHSIYISNNYIKQKNGKLKIAKRAKSQNFTFKNLDKSVFGHTSGTIFRNVVFSKKIPKIIYGSIGTKNEKTYRGDTFRNLVHLNKGTAYFDEEPGSVYRITGDGIWTSLNEFQKNLLNARLYLNMFFFFKKEKPIYFIKISWFFCQKNIHILSQLKRKVQKTDIGEFEKVLTSCLKLKNKFLFNNTDNSFYPNFVFFYPSRNTGGYQYLFIRLARLLSEVMNFKVYYVDYIDGFARKELKKSKVLFIDHNENSKEKIDIEQPFNLITSLTMGHEIPEISNPLSKITLWCAHPKSTLWLKSRSNMNNEKLKNFLNILKKYNSIGFMDWACWQHTNELSGIKFSKTYVPIFTDKKKINVSCVKNIVKKNEINIGWLGRLDSDKIYSLINLLDNYVDLKSKYKKNIHIIGDGDSKHLIELSKYSKQINIKFTSTLINNKPHEYLCKNVDILFSMGTSALEAASLKIPSVLVFLSTESFRLNKYIWLHNSKNFNLGIYVEQEEYSKIKTNNLKNILYEIYHKENKLKLGLRCYDYFNENHSAYNTMISLLSLIFKNNFTYEKYPLKNDAHMKNITHASKSTSLPIMKKPTFRIITRFKLVFYSILLLINQIPIINKFLLSRDEIVSGINETIFNEKNNKKIKLT